MDLGNSYRIEKEDKLEKLKVLAVNLEREKIVRWVIVDDDDNPRFWSKSINAMMEAPKDSMIATEDPYAKKILSKKGYRVMDTKELLFLAGYKGEIPEDIAITPALCADTLKTVEDLVEKGLMKIVDSDNSKTGELAGDYEEM